MTLLSWSDHLNRSPGGHHTSPRPKLFAPPQQGGGGHLTSPHPLSSNSTRTVVPFTPVRVTLVSFLHRHPTYQRKEESGCRRPLSLLMDEPEKRGKNRVVVVTVVVGVEVPYCVRKPPTRKSYRGGHPDGGPSVPIESPLSYLSIDTPHVKLTWGQGVVGWGYRHSKKDLHTLLRVGQRRGGTVPSSSPS